jgi:hypothetical protein
LQSLLAGPASDKERFVDSTLPKNLVQLIDEVLQERGINPSNVDLKSVDELYETWAAGAQMSGSVEFVTIVFNRRLWIDEQWCDNDPDASKVCIVQVVEHLANGDFVSCALTEEEESTILYYKKKRADLAPALKNYRAAEALIGMRCPPTTDPTTDNYRPGMAKRCEGDKDGYMMNAPYGCYKARQIMRLWEHEMEKKKAGK